MCDMAMGRPWGTPDLERKITKLENQLADAHKELNALKSQRNDSNSSHKHQMDKDYVNQAGVVIYKCNCGETYHERYGF
jgi:hypothetical protein